MVPRKVTLCKRKRSQARADSDAEHWPEELKVTCVTTIYDFAPWMQMMFNQRENRDRWLFQLVIEFISLPAKFKVLEGHDRARAGSQASDSKT